MANFIHHQLELPPRNRDAHKGDFGRILIIGGSRGMIGAPAFSANAAFASGAGLVRMALPATIQIAAATLAPGATSYPLGDTPDGLIRDTASDIAIIKALIAENDVIVFGPGLGHGPDCFLPLMTEILSIKDKSVIIDADGLNCLSRVILAGQVSDKLSANFILTPHMGEMKRLWQAWFRQDMPAGRLKCAEKLARTSSAIVLLKGMGSITTDGTISYQNETGNPGMAVGGSGDVLTGIIAGICGNKHSGIALLESTALGAYIHGLAGDLAAADKGEISLTPQDIINFLPQAWKRFMSRENQPPAQK